MTIRTAGERLAALEESQRNLVERVGEMRTAQHELLNEVKTLNAALQQRRATARIVGHLVDTLKFLIGAVGGAAATTWLTQHGAH